MLEAAPQLFSVVSGFGLVHSLPNAFMKLLILFGTTVLMAANLQSAV